MSTTTETANALTDALLAEFDAAVADAYVRLHLAARAYARRHGGGKPASVAFDALEGAAFGLAGLLRDWLLFGLAPRVPTHPLLPALVDAALAWVAWHDVPAVLLPHAEYTAESVARLKRLCDAARAFRGEVAP